MKTPRLAAAYAASLFLVGALAAADFNVSSQSQLNSAIASAAPGDNIIIANGTYSGLNIDLTCSGTSSAPITLRAATSGSVILTGNSRVRLAGPHLVVRGLRFNQVDPTGYDNVVLFDNADNGRLTQCAFYQCGKDKWKHIVKLANGTANARVDHNYFERIQGQGIGIVHNSGCTDNRIDHNRINRTEGDGGENNGFEPIQLGQGGYDTESMRTIVEFNIIENMLTSEDADPELISVKTGNNIIRYNTLRGNSNDRALTLRSAANCTVEGNFLLGCGIRAYGPGHKIINNYVSGASDGIHLPGGNGSNYANTTNCLIANNTVINAVNDGIELSGDGTGGGTQISNITVRNNLVQGGSGILFYQRSGLSGISYSANLGYNTGSATVSSGATVALTSNPNLANDGTLLRLPSGSSPAKDAGVAVTEVTSDMDGQSRSGTLDIGADEYSTAAVTRGVLANADVGPAWLGGPAEDGGSGGTSDAAPVAASEDTYVAGATTTTNFGTDTLIGAKEDGTASISFDRIAYLKFDLSSLATSPTSATLVLATDVTTEAGTVTANQLTNDAWTETGTTWANKPAHGSSIAAATVAAATATDVSINVTSYIQNQFTTDSTKIASIALTGTNAKLWFKSREAGAADAPTLVFTGGGSGASTPAIVTSTTSVSVNEGTSSTTFGVKLASAPSTNVVVTVAKSSGDADITVTGGASLTFTTANWSTYQNVTLAAAEDTDTTNGSATITASATGTSAVNVTATEADNDTPGTGLTGTYYNNTTLSGTPVLTRTDATVNFSWGTGSPGSGVNADNFSVRWTGEVKSTTAGTYTFFVNSNDGNRLWVNGVPLTNRWTDGASEQSGTITLAANTSYSITLETYEGANSASAVLSWTPPGGTKAVIPQANLYP